MGLTHEGRLFNHSKFPKFNKCVLDADHVDDDHSKLLIVDSMCPLGIAVVKELQNRGINHLDVRGPSHLDLNLQSGHQILHQFNIHRALIVCSTPMTRRFYVENKENFTFLSAVPEFQTKVNFIIKHDIFGHMRGKYSKNHMLNLFFACRNHSFGARPKENQNYVLAADVAKIIAENINSLCSVVIDVPVYKGIDLYDEFYSHCITKKRSSFVENLLNDCKPYPPKNRTLTLSMVGSISDNNVYIDRFGSVLKYFEHYLSFYPPLPFEFVVVYSHTREESFPFEEALKAGPNIRKHIRVIEISYDKFLSINSSFALDDYPEYIMKNIGIRRARGEYIAGMSFDVFPNKKLLDMILYHQFTPSTLHRGYRLDFDFDNMEQALKVMENEVNTLKEYFVYYFHARKLMDLYFVFLIHGGGDFQCTHWKTWENIRGYVEGNYVYHVDTLFTFEVVSSLPNYALMKSIGNFYHYGHPDVSIQKQVLPINISEALVMLNESVLSKDTFQAREDWGHPNDKEFPPIVF